MSCKDQDVRSAAGDQVCKTFLATGGGNFTTVEELRECGFKPKQLRAVGFTAADLKVDGRSAAEMRVAGFSCEQLKHEGGFSLMYTCEEGREV